MDIYWFVLGILGVWRLAHLLQAEDGPWRFALRLRRWASTGFWGEVLGCLYCLTLWIALPFAMLLGDGWGERLLLWPALSAGAILVERLAGRDSGPPLATYVEDDGGEERQNVVLRQTATAVHGHPAVSQPPSPIPTHHPQGAAGSQPPAVL
jgi:hypothetical protein